MSYAFNPSLGELTLWALGRCGVRRPEVTAVHLTDAAMSANLIFSDWTADQPNLWTVDLQSVALVAGTASYTLPGETVSIMSAYVRTTAGTTNTDRILTSIGRDTYAAYSDKGQQGIPSTFWFDRIDVPTITLYLVPDGNGPYTLFYYRTKQDADAALQSGGTTDLPYRMLRAFADRLAADLAVSYAPAMAPALLSLAAESYTRAKAQDVEHVPLTIMPRMMGY